VSRIPIARTFGALFAALLCLRGEAAALSFTGALAADDDVQTFSFTLSAPGAVTLQTWSYAGGTNAAGTAIGRGGFDPGIAVFDALGNLVDRQDDGATADVAVDPLTNEQFDVYLVTSLGAGTYTAAVTQFDNVALGPVLASGFSRAGAGNFTAAFGCLNGQFCDVDAVDRTAAWAADVSGATVVPLPGTLGLLAAGLVALWGRRQRAVPMFPAALLAAVALANPLSASAVELCFGKVATIVGKPGDDIINGTKYPDVIVGLAGNDTINGGSGNDLICAGPGNDTVSGGNGSDRVDGGSGNDSLAGDFGSDVLVGGLGNDALNGGIAIDSCDGGIGTDTPTDCEFRANVNLKVKKVSLPVWSGSFSPASGPRAGQSITTLDGALIVPEGATKKIAVLATHGAMGSFRGGVPGWLPWWLERYRVTALTLNRRDSIDYGPNEGGGNTLHPQAVCDLKSGVDYLVNTLGYQGVFILGHSKGTVFSPIYPSWFRNCGADVASSPFNNDPRVVAVATYGTVADGREGAQYAPLAGGVYAPDVAAAQAEVAAGRGDQLYVFQAGITTSLGILRATITVTPNSFLSYYGPDTLSVPEREALKLDIPYLIIHAEGDTVTPQLWSDRLYTTLSTAGKDVTYQTPAYNSLYGSGGLGQEGFPAHSADAEQARDDLTAAIYNWLAGKVAAAAQDATGINGAAIDALPDLALGPTPPNPEKPQQ